jgi:hypothetical protein
MSDYKDIMVDLETLGKGPNAAIVSIGAVAFDLQTMSPSTFERRIGADSSLQFGTIDASTLLWWYRQDPHNREMLFVEEGAHHLDSALREFASWASQFGNIKTRRVWSNGAAFDNVILRSAYAATEIEAPWSYWNDRCFRTLKSLYPKLDLAFTGTRHSALDDAKHQVEYMHALWTISGGQMQLEWD